MAARYWVSANGDVNDTASWSTSSGGSGGASVPGASDEAIFDRGNVSALINVTTPTNATWGAITVRGSDNPAFGFTGTIGATGSRLTVAVTTLTMTNLRNGVYIAGNITTAYLDGTAQNRGVFGHSGGTITTLDQSDGYGLLDGSITTHYLMGGTAEVGAITTYTNVYVGGASKMEPTLITAKVPQNFVQVRGYTRMSGTQASSMDYTVDGGVLEYNGTTVPVNFRLRGGRLDLSNNPVGMTNFGSTLFEHWQGSELVLANRGPTTTFGNSGTPVKRGAGLTLLIKAAGSTRALPLGGGGSGSSGLGIF